MSYATSALATFENILVTLDHLASKAADAGMTEGLLASAKLAEDMFPLETQFRIAINQVRLALGRVWSMEVPLDETEYASFAEVRGRLAEAARSSRKPGRMSQRRPRRRSIARYPMECAS